MLRAPSDKKAEAEKLFNKGMKLVDISKKLGIPEGTIRSWKNRGKWGEKTSKKTSATLQKRMMKEMQRCKKGNEADSPAIETQKGQKEAPLHFVIRMQKRMALTQKYIGILLMKMNWI